MQADPLLTGNVRSVRILGVNGIGEEGANAAVVAGRTLPWLQDVASVDIWTSWQVTYRDVILLNEENAIVGVFNLTSQDLGDASHYDSLRTMLVNAAND